MTHSFHKLTLGLAALTLSVMTWALPAPKDIEAAVSAGQFSKAESMLREVIQSKPQSAKAHYELGEVLARESHYQEALQELNQSKALDPSLKFASDPQKFHEVYDKISQLASAKTPTQVSSSAQVPAPAAPPPSNSGLPSWIWVLAGAFGLGGLFYVLNKPKPAAPVVYAPDPGVSPAQAPRGFGAQYAPAGAPAYPAPAAAPSSSPIAGAVIGGLAGVAAGYAISKALEGDHHQTADQPHPSNNYDVNYDKPQAPPDLGSFDAGSGGDNWDSSSAGSSDDEW